MSKTYLMEKLTGQQGKYAVFNSDGSISAQTLNAGAVPQIRITSEKNMVTVKVNNIAAQGSGTEWWFNCDSYGNYHVVANDGNKDYDEYVDVKVVKQYVVEATFGPDIKTTFNDNSWEVIRQVSDMGIAATTWNIGDCKEVKLNGSIGDNFTASNLTTYMFIIGFDHDINTELPGGHTITLQGFKSSLSDSNTYALVDSGYNSSKTSGKWFNMKNSKSNSGGWADSTTLMRTNIMPAFIAALPSDMQSVLKTVTKQYIPTYNVASVSTCQDKAFLLSESEIFGGIKYAKTSEGSQYAWFLDKGITTSAYSDNVRYKFNTSGKTTETCFWWERSPFYNNSYRFCLVNTNGGADSNTASYSYGVAPAVCV